MDKAVENLLKKFLSKDHFFPQLSMNPEQLCNELEVARDGITTSCSYLHSNSCTVDMILTFFKKMPNPAKAYFIIHLAQTLILKRKKLFSKKHGLETLRAFFLGFVKSTVFLMLI